MFPTAQQPLLGLTGRGGMGSCYEQQRQLHSAEGAAMPEIFLLVCF